MDRLHRPHVRVRFAQVLLVACLVLWPITSLTLFREEPQGVLGLSWLALLLTALDILATTDVRREQE